MKDIDYFKESKMDSMKIADFYSTLPLRFRNKLENSKNCCYVLHDWLGPENLAKSDRISRDKVLLPVDDIQEIKFCYNCSAKINFVPLFGQVAYGASRFFNEWWNVYFDVSTGEALAFQKQDADEFRRKNRESAEMNRRGEILLSNNNYVQALEQFKSALNVAVTASYKERCQTNIAKAESAQRYHNEQQNRERRFTCETSSDEDDDEWNSRSQTRRRNNNFQISNNRLNNFFIREFSNIAKAESAQRYHKEQQNRERRRSTNIQISKNRFNNFQNFLTRELPNTRRYRQSNNMIEESSSDDTEDADDDTDDTDDDERRGRICQEEQRKQRALEQERERQRIMHEEAKRRSLEESMRMMRLKQKQQTRKAEKQRSEASRLNDMGILSLTNGDYQTATELFVQALSLADSPSFASKLIKKRIKNRELAQFKSTMRKTWGDVWTLEENGNLEESKKKLQSFLANIREVLTKSPSDEKLKRYKKMATLKNEGNLLFNTGLSLYEIGIELLNESKAQFELNKTAQAKEKLQNARAHFKDALEKFTDGLNQGDNRFSSCIDIVTNMLEIVDQKFSNISELSMLNLRNNFREIETEAFNVNYVDVLERNTTFQANIG